MSLSDQKQQKSKIVISFDCKTLKAYDIRKTYQAVYANLKYEDNNARGFFILLSCYGRRDEENIQAQVEENVTTKVSCSGSY
uniref:Uncharacterized protein n=1 Tax=Tanacetum cinerariifolium TaxID=118510 RepID=A0A699H164_TANCI|nr:hypothetical protein [Tanacetum cinerariifolium]